MLGTAGADFCRSFDIPGDGFEFYKYNGFLAPNVYDNPALGARISSHRWGASSSSPGGNITITVGNYGVPPSGTLEMQRCSLIDVSSRGSGGAIALTAGKVADLDGLILSEAGESGTGAVQPPGGGPINVRAGCELTVSDTGMISSKGQDPGADLVHLKGCTVTIYGIVQSTTIAGHANPNSPANHCNTDPTAHPLGAASAFTACVRILGQDITIDTSGAHNGNVNVDGERAPNRGWIDIFATHDVTILTDTGSPWAVSADACASGPCSNSFGGVVTIKAIGGKVATSGQNAVKANATAIGSDGGNVTIEAGGAAAGIGDVALDASFIEAKTALSSDNTVGGTIGIRSFNGAITSGGSSAGHIDASGGQTAGAITLTECANVDSYLGTVTPAATENRNVCTGAPTVPADAQTLFDQNAPIWEACHPFSPPTKSGMKFDDANNNGTKDPGEGGINGWTIDLLDTQNQIQQQTQTDQNGNYTFSIPAPGTYRVCEEQQSGWAQTFPHDGLQAPSGESIVSTCPAPAVWGYEFTVAGGETLTGDDFGNFQSAPLAQVTHACAASGLDVTVKNVGNQAGTFSINGTSQVLQPGESLTVNVAVAENASVLVTVLMNGSDVPGSPFTFLRDCEQPGAKVADNCTVRGVDVFLSNTGSEPTTFTVLKSGNVIDTVVVNGGVTVVKSYPLNEDEVATIRVTAIGFDSGDQFITHDCVHVSSVPIVTVQSPTATIPVQPVTSSSLAFTGDPTSVPLALAGGLFTMTGTLAVLASHKMRRRRFD